MFPPLLNRKNEAALLCEKKVAAADIHHFHSDPHSAAGEQQCTSLTDRSKRHDSGEDYST